MKTFVAYSRIFFIFTVIALSIYVVGKEHIERIFLPNQGIVQPITPENTIIAFDIHAVLVEKNKGKMWKTALKNVGAFKFAFNKKIRSHIKSLGKDAAPEDYLLPLLGTVKGLEKYIPGFLNLINAQDEIPGTKRIIGKLAAHRFKLYVLSNIGPAAYYGWQSPVNPCIKTKGLKDKYPDIFKHFTGEMIHAKKPMAQGYITFATMVTPQKGNQKQIIFIDDRQDNIDAAVRQGFIGIRFENALQLQSDLMKLGILI